MKNKHSWLSNLLIKKILRTAMRLVYRVRIVGLENYPTNEERVMIIANHVSFLDGMLLAAFIPDDLSFVVHSYYSDNKWLKFFFGFVKIFTVDQLNPFMLKNLVKEVKNGNHCVIFPEGKITTTGSLMKIYEGPGLIADKSDAWVVPICIEGPQYTPFTRLKQKLHRKFFPKVTVTIAPARKIHCSDEYHGRMRRKVLGYQIADIMTDLIFQTKDYKKTLFTALYDARNIYGRRKKILEDLARKPLSYQQIFMRSFILGDIIRRQTQPNEYVGIMLPTTNAAVVCLFAMYAAGRIPAILNFTSGANVLLNVCAQTPIKTIYTSRQFVKKAKLLELVETLTANQVKIIFLEDIKPQITLFNKLSGLIKGFFPNHFYKKYNPKAFGQDTAVLLFTSGSETFPKGVLLSHENILANIHQLIPKYDFNKEDVVLNALPIFHSFGFMGVVMPLFLGASTFCYPSPIHYRAIPEVAYDIDATIIFGTDTFLRNYANYAHPYDFYRIRYVLAGGEQVKNETRELWFEKFGVRLIEGYGITETSPVIACNTPTHYKTGTVGRFVSCVEYKLEKIPELETESAGKLWVKGPNILKGYLINGKIIPPQNGWYDTGDIVAIDALGYITILGRVKRFAKISGEMISLSAVENHIASMDNNHSHAVLNTPHLKKGEMLVLVTESPDLTREKIIEYFKNHQIGMLMLPKEVLFQKTLPRTAAGKIDYRALDSFVRESSLS